MSAPIHIFLHTECDKRRESWRGFLSNSTLICVANLDALAPQTLIDVVITDQQIDVSSLVQLAPLGTDHEDAMPGYDGGLIEIRKADSGRSSSTPAQELIVGPASVSLPHNVTERELNLAVRLVTQIVRLRRDYGAQDQLSNQYQLLAFQDSLTSIANRRAWDQEVATRWEHRLSQPRSICLALFDVDQLKQINDRMGHAEGDAVLRAAANALVTSVRDHDFVARLGGDEFGVLLEGIEPASAHRISDRIRRSTSHYLATGKTPCDELPVTTSAGYACAQPDDTVDSLFRRADAALRRSKQFGGNTTTGADS